jgi:hypothetical protein
MVSDTAGSEVLVEDADVLTGVLDAGLLAVVDVEHAASETTRRSAGARPIASRRRGNRCLIMRET